MTNLDDELHVKDNDNNEAETWQEIVTANDKISWIEARRSISNLDIPAPNQMQIKAAIHCAMTAPDHKKLKPYRFIVTTGNARHELARAFVAAQAKQLADQDKEMDEKIQKKTYNMPLRAPVIITVVTSKKYHEKVPEFEQLLSAGAGVQNLILALQAQGFSSIWRTGLLSNEAEIKNHFKVAEEDYVVGFIYTGTAHCKQPKRRDFEIDDYVIFE